ncbi:MAG: winged helix-turn-helix transcriptional regulator [Thermoplasmata archaeon]|nr:winged helix-turn-helix transcriptional regulator [Thermoplasmata archaeon]
MNKMKDMARAANLEIPTFETNGIFKTTFFRPKIVKQETTTKPSPDYHKVITKLSPDYHKVITKLSPDYNKTTLNILELIIENPKITRKELADSLGMTRDGVQYHLEKLKKDGIIKRVGGRRGGHWEVS